MGEKDAPIACLLAGCCVWRLEEAEGEMCAGAGIEGAIVCGLGSIGADFEVL